MKKKGSPSQKRTDAHYVRNLFVNGIYSTRVSWLIEAIAILVIIVLIINVVLIWLSIVLSGNG